MRAFPITSAKEGMNRLRNKGGADKDSFYMLKNCYVTSSRSVVPRPGTRGDFILPANTRGLMAFREKLYVFASEYVVIVSDKYVVQILQHPDPDSTAQLRKIHFAQPFLGYPYVVAEFDDDDTKFYHYWLQEFGSWEANHVYPEFAVIQPTIQNGYTYTATRLNPAAPVWGPLQPRTVGDVVEPTVGNGYQYEVIDTIGLNPASGTVEPAWIAEDGALVYENVDGSGSTTTPPPTLPPSVPPDVTDRYGNQGGSGHFKTVER